MSDLGDLGLKVKRQPCRLGFIYSDCLIIVIASFNSFKKSNFSTTKSPFNALESKFDLVVK